MQPHTYTWTLSNEMGKFIETFEWTHFLTLTTKHSLSTKSARRLGEKLHNQLNCNNVTSTTLWVAEPFDTKEGEHIHALVSLDGLPLRHTKNHILKACTNAMGLRFKNDMYTTVIDYKKGLGANSYIAKYLYRKNADWDIYLPGVINL